MGTRFLKKLEEALEAPDLPDEDRWQASFSDYSNYANSRIAEIFGQDRAWPTQDGDVQLDKEFDDANTYHVILMARPNERVIDIIGMWNDNPGYDDSMSIPLRYETHNDRDRIMGAVKTMFDSAEQDR